MNKMNNALIKRMEPYIWVTWASKLMAGETSCTYSAWIKAQFKGYETIASSFNQAEWMLNHTSLLNKIKAELTVEGKSFTVESQNKFTIVGNSGAVLSGKPDLVTVSDGFGKIIDAKTGRPKASDVAQVQIYMFALSRLTRYSDTVFCGELVYTDQRVDIPAESIDKSFKAKLAAILGSISTGNEPPKTPSYDECKYCNVAASVCSERIDTPPVAETASNFDF